MAINSDTEINLALLQLGKNANRYRLNQNSTPHEIIEWDSGNKDSQPTDDELFYHAGLDRDNQRYQKKAKNILENKHVFFLEYYEI